MDECRMKQGMRNWGGLSDEKILSQPYWILMGKSVGVIWKERDSEGRIPDNCATNVESEYRVPIKFLNNLLLGKHTVDNPESITST